MKNEKIDLTKVRYLGDLILIALEDLNQTRLDPRYKINMGEWHTRYDKICHVCLAGCVLKKHIPLKESNGINGLNLDLQNIAYALNDIRNGNLVNAFNVFYDLSFHTNPIVAKLNGIRVTYSSAFPENKREQDIWIKAVSNIALQILKIELEYE